VTRVVETVLFDLGGVLVEWDPRHLYRQLLPDDRTVEDFLAEVGFAEWNRAMDAGERTWEEAVADLAARYPHRHELIAAYPRRFGDTLAGAVDGSVALLHRLHERGTRLLALTNWSAETFPVARERFAFLRLFEGIVVSGEERLAKPDPAIFDLVVRRYGLEPAATLFVDDDEHNVLAARAAGLQAVRFTDPPALEAELSRRGLLGRGRPDGGPG
jgi:2-haloacid dehalogenase